MVHQEDIGLLLDKYIVSGDHRRSDYFSLLKELVKRRAGDPAGGWQARIDDVYAWVEDEIRTNDRDPENPIKFGTSGWRGTLGKDVFMRTVACVTEAIASMYASAEDDLLSVLGVSSLDEARTMGCVVGFDNRFCGELFGQAVARILAAKGFTVYYAGESTTGTLSASVLVRKAACSINLTPSHNPLEYGGYKYNAADGGPAAPELTGRITELANGLIRSGFQADSSLALGGLDGIAGIRRIDALEDWKRLVSENESRHRLNLERTVEAFAENDSCFMVIDSVHGASRLNIPALFAGYRGDRLQHIRNDADVTFGGIAPEPSSVNMRGVVEILNSRQEQLKLGAIIDPDGDRIRFTDGTTEISMNQFGAMAYHFLVEYKKLKGPVAKTVATSNLANSLADAFGEELFEPRVGFKEFKPVIGKALVLFEESDGISIIGHTPEKDAYIGLLLALDMVLTTGKNLGTYLAEIERRFGAFYPDRDGIEVGLKGDALLAQLGKLEKYGSGVTVRVGGSDKTIARVITIDGRKMIFEDGSWLMIRPSGTEPKVRFYVESRTEEGTSHLVEAARQMLFEVGVI